MEFYVFLYLISFGDNCNIMRKIVEVFFVISWVYKMVGFFNFCLLNFIILVIEGCYRIIEYKVVNIKRIDYF